MAPNIVGTFDPAFARVREAFAANFDRDGEVGAAVCAVIGGRTVVDLWGGHMDKSRTKPWHRDTIANIYSTTKGLVATCANRLADQGKLDFDAPVARYWPEFAAAGKDKIPVRWLLSHRAGLPAIRKTLAPETGYDWNAITAALAAEPPWWEPGTMHGYHAITYGWLVGEVIRRVSGKNIGAFLRDEIARPCGLDMQIGVDASFDPRIAEMVAAPPPPADAPPNPLSSDPESMTFKAINNPLHVLDMNVVNGRAWRAAQIPGANGHATARAVAGLYGALANGGRHGEYRIMSVAAIERAQKEQSFGMDAILGRPTRVGLGYMLAHPDSPLGPNPNAFGHSGAGGSLGFADTNAKLGFGYVMNQMGADMQDTRAAKLFNAIFESL
jgi:CubicO group peptidase (beta-lactamase class C family)